MARRLRTSGRRGAGLRRGWGPAGARPRCVTWRGLLLSLSAAQRRGAQGKAPGWERRDSSLHHDRRKQGGRQGGKREGLGEAASLTRVRPQRAAQDGAGLRGHAGVPGVGERRGRGPAAAAAARGRRRPARRERGSPGRERALARAFA